MDIKGLVGQTLLELKDGLGDAWAKLTPAEQQLVKDVAEEVTIAGAQVLLLGDQTAQDRFSRAKVSARALAFGGALIAKGILEEKILAAVSKAFQFILAAALSKIA